MTLPTKPATPVVACTRGSVTMIGPRSTSRMAESQGDRAGGTACKWTCPCRARLEHTDPGLRVREVLENLADVVLVHSEAELAKIDRLRCCDLVSHWHWPEPTERPRRPVLVMRPDGLPDRLQVNVGNGHSLDVDPVPCAVPLAAVRTGLATVELHLRGPLVVDEFPVEVLRKCVHG